MASMSTMTAQADERARKDNTRYECEATNRSTQCEQISGKLVELRRENTHAIPSADIQHVTEDLYEVSICPSNSPNPAGDPFVHEPIQLNTASIRLVDILPPHTNGTIRCSVRHTQISGPLVKTAYTCLSYAWGPPATTHTILMNEKPMKVGHNLWEFLCAVTVRKWKDPGKRHSIGSWYHDLWIDALCIDQTNDKEKNHQVQKMGRIYQGANEVIAWLGGDPSTAALFDYDEKDIPEFLGRGTEKSQLLRDLYQDLGEITYWNRAWVVQEIILAKDVYFLSRESTIRLYDLRRIGEKLGVLARVPEVAGLLKLVTERSMTVRPFNLIEIVELFRNKGCKDVRDRIYSVLSISCDGARLPVKYDSSMVELARSALRLYKDGVCLPNVFTILQAIEMGSKDLGLESYWPFIGLHRLKMQQHISPCTQCGEHRGTFPESISIPTVTDTRYICLHCNHSGLSMPIGVHQVCHNGHLCLVQGTELKSGSYDWHLFWMPFGGICWRKLEHQKYIITTKHGAFRALSLSVALVCELIELISLEQNHDAHYDLALEELKHRSFRRIKWTVFKQLGGSTTHETVSEINGTLPATQDQRMLIVARKRK
jgi:hypothetical protein